MSTQRRPPLTQAQIDEESTLATRYVLGEMSEEEFADFEARYASDLGFRERYDSWSSSLDLSPANDEPKTPGESFQAWLIPSQEDSIFGRLGVIPSVVGALIAALLVAFVSNQGLLTAQDQAPIVQTVLANNTGSVLAEASFDPSRSVVDVVFLGAAPMPPHVHEVWLVVADGAPSSLGILGATQAGTEFVLTRAQSIAVPGAVLMITREPIGGAGAAGPTGEVVAAGAFAAP